MSDDLIEKAKKCALYDFDSIEMVECNWALWQDIINALSPAVAPLPVRLPFDILNLVHDGIKNDKGSPEITDGIMGLINVALAAAATPRLEALRRIRDFPHNDTICEQAMSQIAREALAAAATPPSPEDYAQLCQLHGKEVQRSLALEIERDALLVRVARSAAAPPSEPVAWICWYQGNCDATVLKSRMEDWVRLGRKIEPVYSHSRPNLRGDGK